jgi:uncharacterized protein (TIGR02145 family)
MKKVSIIILGFLSVFNVMAQPQKKIPQNSSQHSGLTVSQSQTVKDIDGNVYHTVTIGKQTWMLENLKTTKYNDGTPIPLIVDDSEWSKLTTPGYCWYNNDEAANKNIYGGLYNWYAVNTGKLAPTGWHVPTDAEWSSLGDFLMKNGYNFNGTIDENYYAKALASETGWQTDNTAMEESGVIGSNTYPVNKNKSGFTALPGGNRYDNAWFERVGFEGFWWSSTAVETGAVYRILSFNSDFLGTSRGSMFAGLSVRCVKDL